MLSDKDNTPFSVDEPSEFLSERAIDRRERDGIAVTEQDLPVNPQYIEAIQNWKEGINVLHSSRWFNAVAVSYLQTLQDESGHFLTELDALPFVADTMLLSKEIYTSGKTGTPDKFATELELKDTGDWLTITDESYGDSFNQLQMNNGVALHGEGYTGQGITIAVMDSGFPNVDQIAAFNHLFDEERMIMTKDMGDIGASVYDPSAHFHGTNVLSIMAGYTPGEYIGAAPGASYMLFRTEMTDFEQRIEEINWAVAAEIADSAGADIVTTSLGYSDFDFDEFDYTPEQMDGETAIITQGADIAASKGMLIINSAGNSGSNPNWGIITAPADGDSVMAVGAVHPDSTLVSFSSRGPSSDGQIKPEVMGQGTQVYQINPFGSYVSSQGTSYSAPIIAGLSACVWQTDPDKSAIEVRNAMIESSSLYPTSNDSMGYGIPNAIVAADIFSNISTIDNLGDTYPKPFLNQQLLTYFAPESGELNISFFDQNGKMIFEQKENVVGQQYQSFQLKDIISNLPKSMYIIRLQIGNNEQVLKVVKR